MDKVNINRDIPWLSQAYSAATGSDITPRELLRAGERVFNLEKLLNVREGFSREDDRIPLVYLQNIEVPSGDIGSGGLAGLKLGVVRQIADPQPPAGNPALSGQ